MHDLAMTQNMPVLRHIQRLVYSNKRPVIKSAPLKEKIKKGGLFVCFPFYTIPDGKYTITIKFNYIVNLGELRDRNVQIIW